MKSKLSKRLVIPVTPEQKRTLDKVAALVKKSPADFVRDAIREHIEREGELLGWARWTQKVEGKKRKETP